MQKKVSILIPVYNVQNYLEECMESAVHQTYNNLELICIDDGSTDNAGQILDDYCNKYDFVKVIHKNNTGYGNSMNIALDCASGEYISILEPDDFIDLNTIEHIINIFDKNPGVDFVKCDFAYLWGEKGNYSIKPQKIWSEEGIYKKVITGKEIYKLFRGYIAHWSAIYKKSFLTKNHIRFNETKGASYQDWGFWFQTIAFAEAILMENRYFYYYRQDNPFSSMKNKSKIYCVFDECNFVQHIIRQSHKERELIPYYIRNRYIAGRDTFYRIIPEYRKEFIKRMQTDFVRLQREGLLDETELSEKEKAFLSSMMKSAENFYYEQYEAYEKILNIINQCDELYIYGAGKVAGDLLRLLTEEQKKKVKAFIVTKSEALCEMSGIPIREIKQVLPDELKEHPIIIAVSDTYKDEIIAVLKVIGINEIICFDSNQLW